MKGSFLLVVVVIIAFAACAVAVYQLSGSQERPPVAKQAQQPRVLATQQRPAITVEVRERKLFVNGKPVGELPQTEAISVMVADGKVYVNGKQVWTAKTDQFVLRLRPEGLRPEPEMPLPETRLKRMEEFVAPTPPPWLTEKEREEFKRDMQKWHKKSQEYLQRERPEREFDAHRKEMLEEIEKIQQRMEQLGRHLKELQERSRIREKPPLPEPERAPRRPLEPSRQTEEESAEKLERHLEKLLDALERGEEFVRPKVEEFLKKIENLTDEHMEKLFDRYLEKKLKEGDDLIQKMMDRYLERMRRPTEQKESPPHRR